MIDRSQLPAVKAYFAPQRFTTKGGVTVLCAIMRLVRAYDMVRFRADDGARQALSKHYGEYCEMRDAAIRALEGKETQRCNCSMCMSLHEKMGIGPMEDGWAIWIERVIDARLLLWGEEDAEQTEKRVDGKPKSRIVSRPTESA